MTDHRIGLTIHRLQETLDGDLDEIVSGLIAHHQAEKLKAAGSGGATTRSGGTEAAASR